jgi:hypothetical protein
MTAFRALLAMIFVGLTLYTVNVVLHHGIDIAPIFFGGIRAMDWSGQFNLDFFCFLILTALWVAWRHDFSLGGLLLGVIAVNLGAIFLAAYLLIALGKVRGHMAALLLGERRAGLR